MDFQDYIISVIPRSSINEVVAETPGYLKIKLTVAPVHGKANQALATFLAKKFNVSKSQVEILKGLTSKDKLVRIYLPKSQK